MVFTFAGMRDSPVPPSSGYHPCLFLLLMRRGDGVMHWCHLFFQIRDSITFISFAANQLWQESWGSPIVTCEAIWNHSNSPNSQNPMRFERCQIGKELVKFHGPMNFWSSIKLWLSYSPSSSSCLLSFSFFVAPKSNSKKNTSGVSWKKP